MESKSGSDPETYVLPRIRKRTVKEARKLLSGPLLTWLATVALVLIVIGVALSVAAWRERKKQSENVAAQITARRGVNTR